MISSSLAEVSYVLLAKIHSDIGHSRSTQSFFKITHPQAYCPECIHEQLNLKHWNELLWLF